MRPVVKHSGVEIPQHEDRLAIRLAALSMAFAPNRGRRRIPWQERADRAPDPSAVAAACAGGEQLQTANKSANRTERNLPKWLSLISGSIQAKYRVKVRFAEAHRGVLALAFRWTPLRDDRRLRLVDETGSRSTRLTVLRR
jgi:hypothetical protein